MKKLLLAICVSALSACDGSMITEPPLKGPDLLPSEVVRLHKVCQSQPNYRNSWINRVGNAKAVTCQFTDSSQKMGIPRNYTIDAKTLEDRLKGGEK